MKFNPDIHHRRSIRLRDYDYGTAGAYFVTVCAQGRECLFGGIVSGTVALNDAGRMVEDWWAKLPDKFPGIDLDEYIIMPNHFHGIVVNVGAPPCGCPPLSPRPYPNSNTRSGRPHGAEEQGQPHGVAPTLQAFKSLSTVEYVHGVTRHGWPPFPGRLWQRNYYERVVRDEKELARARQYIEDNPLQWHLDAENPANVP